MPKKGPAQPTRVQVAATVAILVAAVACLLLFYQTEVCDQELSNAGQAVDVCRHLTVADPPILLVGLVVVVALTAFFGEISGFGFTLKRAVTQAVQRSEHALALSKSARTISESSERIAVDAAGSVQDKRGAAPDLIRVDALVSDYNDLRQKQPSSPARTAKLFSVISRMISELSGADPSFPFAEYAAAEDGGKRVAAYAFAYAHPDGQWTADLVPALLHEPTAFGQYWAIRALRGIATREPESLSAEAREALRTFGRTLDPREERARELQGLLSDLPT